MTVKNRVAKTFKHYILKNKIRAEKQIINQQIAECQSQLNNSNAKSCKRKTIAAGDLPRFAPAESTAWD